MKGSVDDRGGAIASGPLSWRTRQALASGSGDVILVVQRGREGKLDFCALVMAQARARAAAAEDVRSAQRAGFPRDTSIDVVVAAASAAIHAT